MQCVWEEAAVLGEGPLWVEQENALYWVDIVSKKVHRYDLADGTRQTQTFETEVTSLAVRQQGGLIGTVRDGFAWIDFAAGVFEPIALPETQLSGNRFNDGQIDAHGRFWAGSMDESEQSPTGVLYRLDVDLSVQQMDNDYIITNGPAFSLDGQTMYHTDTAKRTVYAFDLAADGTISHKRPFIQLEKEEEGYPDGMTVDSEDYLWLCHFGGACITRFSPKGDILQVILLAAPNITSCTFAGPNLDYLYITTARYLLREDELQRYPLAGSLFICKPGVTGLPTPSFAG